MTRIEKYIISIIAKFRIEQERKPLEIKGAWIKPTPSSPPPFPSKQIPSDGVVHRYYHRPNALLEAQLEEGLNTLSNGKTMVHVKDINVSRSHMNEIATICGITIVSINTIHNSHSDRKACVTIHNTHPANVERFSKFINRNRDRIEYTVVTDNTEYIPSIP